jgi:hypothetical protein
VADGLGIEGAGSGWRIDLEEACIG